MVVVAARRQQFQQGAAARLALGFGDARFGELLHQCYQAHSDQGEEPEQEGIAQHRTASRGVHQSPALKPRSALRWP